MTKESYKLKKMDREDYAEYMERVVSLISGATVRVIFALTMAVLLVLGVFVLLKNINII